jgi:hypothetical protein
VITFFTIPKPFAGESAPLQRNAIRSWLALSPGCEVILLGDDAGVAEAAREFGVRHEPTIGRNAAGTPLVGAAFAAANRMASHGLLCCINADIILFDDFPRAASRIPFRRFLMAGRRIDIAVEGEADFSPAAARERLRAEAARTGRPHAPLGSDYFLYPKGLFPDLPPFAIGRPAWDSWLIYHARERRIPVVDASGAATVFHQDHGYGHIPAGEAGAEEAANRALAGDPEHLFVLDDATHLLTEDGLVPATDVAHLGRCLGRSPGASPVRRAFHRLCRALWAARAILPERVWRSAFHRLSTRLLP